MATTILVHPNTNSFQLKKSTTSIFSPFIDWCSHQQEYRLLWLGLALVGHGCIITPLTIFAVIISGANIVLFMTAIVAMSMAVVTNLAALPTKYTIPIFLFSILIDLGILIACLSLGFHPGAAL
jgi:hypothetical protein